MNIGIYLYHSENALILAEDIRNEKNKEFNTMEKHFGNRRLSRHFNKA
jgi:hypothetical protein